MRWIDSRRGSGSLPSRHHQRAFNRGAHTIGYLHVNNEQTFPSSIWRCRCYRQQKVVVRAQLLSEVPLFLFGLVAFWVGTAEFSAFPLFSHMKFHPKSLQLFLKEIDLSLVAPLHMQRGSVFVGLNGSPGQHTCIGATLTSRQKR
jgi:hypothetical protein